MTILTRRVLFGIVFSLFNYANVIHANASNAVTNSFEAMDVFSLEWAGDPRVSPDGKTVAYIRNGFNLMNNRRTSRISLIDVDGANHHPMTNQPGFMPRWSPSGDRIAFLSQSAGSGNHTDRAVQLHTPTAQVSM